MKLGPEEHLHKEIAAKMTRTSTELPRLEPESSASTNSAMAANQTSRYQALFEVNYFTQGCSKSQALNHQAVQLF